MKHAHSAGQRRRNPHPTKKGPGRRHAEIPHPVAAVPSAGAPVGHVQRIADSAKLTRRALVKSLGRRQALKAMKQARRQDKLAGATASMLEVA